MAIYRKYWYGNRQDFVLKSENGYWGFLKELERLKSDGRLSVTADDLHFYIRRHSFHIGFKKNYWGEKSRRYYFKFWIKRAEGAGFIEFLNSGAGRWLLTEKLNDIDNNEKKQET